MKKRHRWKLTLEFEGTGFLGWQRQKSGRTVQTELEEALSVFCRDNIQVTGQGRTDRGVHAEGQVAHADLPEGTEPEKLLSAMRGLLPAEIALIQAERVDPTFHARFDAISRRYRYQIATRSVPLLRNQCWLVLHTFDEEMIQTCAEYVMGEHDFINFAKQSAEDPDKSSICKISRSAWKTDGHLMIYTIEGDRFLRHMVRRLVGSMFWVAAGRYSPEDFLNLLNGEERVQKGHTAPPEGLILEKVSY